MGSFLKKHWFLCLMLFGVPIAISVFLYVRFRDEISAIDWLPYLTGLLTYYGTVILAIVTVVQNERITAIQERSNEIIEKQLWNENQPWFELGSVIDEGLEGKLIDRGNNVPRKCCLDYPDGFFSEQYKVERKHVCDPDHIHSVMVELQNNSKIDMSTVRIDGRITSYDVEGKRRNRSEGKYYTIQSIRNGEKIKLQFSLTDELRGDILRTWLVFHNIFGHAFYQELSFAMLVSDDRKRLSCRAMLGSPSPVRPFTIYAEPEWFCDPITEGHMKNGPYRLSDKELIEDMKMDFNAEQEKNDHVSNRSSHQ